jgi:hypothetical protein
MMAADGAAAAGADPSGISETTASSTGLPFSSATVASTGPPDA